MPADLPPQPPGFLAPAEFEVFRLAPQQKSAVPFPPELEHHRPYLEGWVPAHRPPPAPPWLAGLIDRSGVRLPATHDGGPPWRWFLADDGSVWRGFGDDLFRHTEPVGLPPEAALLLLAGDARPADPLAGFGPPPQPADPLVAFRPATGVPGVR